MTESQLSRKWMNRLQQQCAEAKEHILILNCQGKSRLPRGVSDYLVLYKSRWFSIEFKTKLGRRSNYQKDFIEQTNRCKGIGFFLTIDPNYKWYLVECYNTGDTDKLGVAEWKIGEERRLLLAWA